MFDMGFLHWLNPLHYTTPQGYSQLTYHILTTIFKGFGAKVLSIGSFVYAFWSLIRRENVSVFLVFLFFSLLFAYVGGVFNFLF